MLEPELCEKFLIEWNDTKKAYPKNRSVEELFEIQVEKTPNATAAIAKGEKISYREIKQRADFLAHRLRSLGVRSEDVVGLFFERSFAYLIALFAVLKTGAAFVPLDSNNPDQRLLYQIDDTSAKLVLSHTALDQRLADCTVQRINVDKFNWAKVARSQKAFPTVASPDSLMYIMYTSGSTGLPKGVQICQRGILNLLYWIQSEYRIKPEHRMLQMASIAFDNSITEIFWPLLNGASLIIADEGGQRNAEYLVELVKSQGVTHLSTVPSMLRALLDIPQISESDSLQLVTCAGEALTVEVNDKFHRTMKAELHNWYGTTETSVFSTLWRSVSEAKTISIGSPIANTQIYLLDSSGEPVAPCAEGEIWIGGDGVGLGYQNLPEKTAESFIQNPFGSGTDEKLYRTGDLAKFHSDGTLEYLGRIDRQVQLRGVRIEPGEIEYILNQHPDVRECAVVLKEHGPNDLRLLAFYVPFSLQDTPASAELRAYLTRQIPEMMVPSIFVPLDALPLTVSGKVDRKVLISDFPDKLDAAPFPFDGSDAAMIVKIFEETLKCGSVTETDSFFGLGGHSILAMQITNRINQHFQVDLSLRTIFDKPTPVELAECVHQRKNNS